MARFRLLRGIHSQKDTEGKAQVYEAGDVIVTEKDLTKHNHPGAVRFERLGDSPSITASSPQESTERFNGSFQESTEQGFNSADAPSTDTPAGLKNLPVRQLRRIAAERGVDLSGCNNKEEIVNTLTNAQLEEANAMMERDET